MRKIVISILVFGALTTSFCVAQADKQWGQWRGPMGTGAAPADANPPVEWSETKNVRWKTPLFGMGHSSPVVWGNKIFLTAAVPFGEKRTPVFDNAPGSHDNLPVSQMHRFLVFCVERATGRVLWRTQVSEAFPHVGGHMSGSLASASPVTDGRHVVAFFGSQGLYCLDVEGKVLWAKDLGKMQTKHAHGEGASPLLANGVLVVPWDHEGDSAVYAIDVKSGEERWKRQRDEVTSWSTPIAVRHDDRTQVIVSATGRIRAYDLADGSVVWECGGMSNNVVASPVAGDGMVFCGCSYGKRIMIAIKLKGAKGDVTGTENVVWTTNQRTPYVPSPLLYGGRLYFLGHYQGIFSGLDPRTGEVKTGPFRLPGVRDFYASPVGAARRIYLTDREGVTLVLTHEDHPKQLALNTLEDSFSASAAIVGGEMFLRGEKFLYCLKRMGKD